MKGIRTGKEVELAVFEDDWFCIEYPKDSTKKLLDVINKFRKVAGYEINIQNHNSFYKLTTIYLKKNESNSIYNNIKNNKILRNKFNQRSESFLLWKLQETDETN